MEYKLSIDFLALLKAIVEVENLQSHFIVNVKKGDEFSTVEIMTKDKKQILGCDYITEKGFVYEDFLPLVHYIIIYGLNNIKEVKLI